MDKSGIWISAVREWTETGFSACVIHCVDEYDAKCARSSMPYIRKKLNRDFKTLLDGRDLYLYLPNADKTTVKEQALELIRDNKTFEWIPRLRCESIEWSTDEGLYICGKYGVACINPYRPDILCDLEKEEQNEFRQRKS